MPLLLSSPLSSSAPPAFSCSTQPATASSDLTTPSQKHHALLHRLPRSHSAFIYAVTTTRIYCRPTCPSRRARKANILFFDTAKEADRAGFRACKRCRPDDDVGVQREWVQRACRIIEAEKDSEYGNGSRNGGEKGVLKVGSGIGLEELARGVGRTKSHFHRVFKRVVGMTPREYAVLLQRRRRRRENHEAEEVLPSSSSSSPSSGSVPLLEESGILSESDSWSSGFSTPETIDVDNNILRKSISYILAPWASGLVLIALTDSGKICHLDAGPSGSGSEAELVSGLWNRFPDGSICAVEAERGQYHLSSVDIHGKREDMNLVFAEVMEALLRPVGRVLDVDLDLNMNYMPGGSGRGDFMGE